MRWWPCGSGLFDSLLYLAERVLRAVVRIGFLETLDVLLGLLRPLLTQEAGGGEMDFIKAAQAFSSLHRRVLLPQKLDLWEGISIQELIEFLPKDQGRGCEVFRNEFARLSSGWSSSRVAASRSA